MKKNYLSILSIVVVLLITGCETNKNEYSILWEISGNGLKEKSYIFGTSKLASFELDPFFKSIKGFYPALNSASRLVCESYIDFYQMDNDALDNFVKEMFLSDAISYQDIASPENPLKRDSLLVFFLSKCFEGDNNSMIFNYENVKKLIEFCKERESGVNQLSIEAVIREKFLEKKRPITGLDQLCDYEKTIPIKDIIEKYFFRPKTRPSGIDDDLLSEKYNLYIKGYELNELNKFYEDKEFVRMISESDTFDYILEEFHRRNKMWLPYISYLMQEQSSFFLIDIISLFEEGGIIPELQNMGYKLTPLK